MGPIQVLFAQALRDPEFVRMLEQQGQRPHGGLLEEESVFAPRKGIGPRSFRDPQQAGPAPPMNGPIASLYRGQRG